MLQNTVVDEVTLAYESMELTADNGLRLNAYVAEPGTPSAEALALLGSWAATPVELRDDEVRALEEHCVPLDPRSF
jgi:hypothetical protein